MNYPKFGSAPIKCAKRGCGWIGFETDLVASKNTGRLVTVNTCPKCGCASYYFMSDKEIAKMKAVHVEVVL